MAELPSASRIGSNSTLHIQQHKIRAMAPPDSHLHRTMPGKAAALRHVV
jgi:hypothetical protein